MHKGTMVFMPSNTWAKALPILVDAGFANDIESCEHDQTKTTACCETALASTHYVNSDDVGYSWVSWMPYGWNFPSFEHEERARTIFEDLVTDSIADFNARLIERFDKEGITQARVDFE